MNALRVLLLNYEHPPIGGGAATAFGYLLQAIGRMAGEAPRIDLITAGMGAADEAEAPRAGQRVLRLAIRKQALHFWTQAEVARWTLRSLRAARRQIRRQAEQGRPYHLCHAVFAIPAGAIAWLGWARLPYLVSVRGSDVPGFNERFRWQYRVLRPLIRRIWRRAGAVVANSEGLRQLALQTAPGQQIRVIPNGVDTDRFRPPLKRGRGGPVVILTVARLIRRKGLDELVRVAARLHEEGQPFEVRLAGAGRERERLLSLTGRLGIGNRVHLLGRVPHERLPELYRSADLFCLPSHYEGMSNALLEALASGLPAVVSRGCQAASLVDAANGAEVPTRDEEALYRALQLLIADPDRRTAAGAVSRQRAEALSWDAVARRYVDLYHRLSATSRKGGDVRHVDG